MTAVPSSGVAVPTHLDEALDLLAADAGLEPLAGGTDLMVEVNHGARRPTGVVALDRIPELGGWTIRGDELVVGATCTFAEMADPQFVAAAPALAHAARTVGSPQIRHAGTIGGNLATASPAADTVPVLVALGAEVDLVHRDGRRSVSLPELITGVKTTSLRPGELIGAVRIPVADGPQEFCKVGPRNAMVISVASVAVVVDRAHHRIGCGLGSVAPVPLRAERAERLAADVIDWDRPRTTPEDVIGSFAAAAADAARPIDDHRATAAYRRHAVEVLAGRALRRCLS